MKHDISTDQLRAINYFHTVHEAVVQMSSVSQIVKCLEREQKHSALVPAHYTSTSDIQEALGKLLDLYGEKQRGGDMEFDALIARKECLEEYNDWKVFAVRETRHWIEMSQYERIMAMYTWTARKYASHYLNWFKLYKLILLNWASSMSLERLFRARKLYQPATCSNFSYQGLSDRLVLHHNSAEPGSVESVILYMKAMQKWFEMKRKRIYSAVSPLVDWRLQK